jgi:hypothetical protein
MEQQQRRARRQTLCRAPADHQGITSEKGIRDYLVLLSICETCKYVGLDFLDFLRSGEKDIHAFAASRRGRRLGTP